MKTVDYLDSVRRQYTCSDYKAAQLLGVTKQTVSHYRSGKGTFSEGVAIRAAELLGLDPAEVLIATQAERVKNEEAKRILQRAVRQLKRATAAAVLVTLPFLAGALFPAKDAHAGPSADPSSVYYVKLLQWLAGLFAPAYAGT